MTNDEIRRNDEIRMTKPAIAQLRAFRAKSSRAAPIFGARNLFRFNACWSRGAKSLQSLCAVRGLMRTEVRAPFGSGCGGLGYFLTKFSQAAPIFGARNLFRFNACWSRGAKSLQSLCAVRGLMRTEVRAPVGCGCGGLRTPRPAKNF